MSGSSADADLLAPYDGVLVVSFGGPEAPDEVMPFLRKVTGGRGIPDERLAVVAEHYWDRGGISPINEQTRKLVAALETELRSRGSRLPITWGTRNHTPSLADALARLAAAGARRVLALTTSAYPSYSSCRQYRENLHDALVELAASGEHQDAPLQIDLIRQYAHHPGFAEVMADSVRRELDSLPADGPEPQLIFVTHSIPTPMAEASGPQARTGSAYVQWHELLASWVVDRLAAEGPRLPWRLAYCSRSGRPGQPWLEPDVNDLLTELAGQGVRRAVLVPIGFTSDHMEVIQDLDTEALGAARELGLQVRRAATAGTDPRFVSGLVDLLAERAAVARREAVSPQVIEGGFVGHAPCPAGCCENLREPGRPAACGVDSESLVR